PGTHDLVAQGKSEGAPSSGEFSAIDGGSGISTSIGTVTRRKTVHGVRPSGHGARHDGMARAARALIRPDP
ncbi:MAG: hypothetical protein E6Y22_08035, partial [Cutibacterium granulosum]|nr:hypothetical protein [Cutibacterium granulosum]